MEPDPKKVAFFQSNKAEISEMIKRENIRRERRNLIPLSEDEIDDAIGEMMSLVAEKQRIRAFKFPELPKKPEPQRPSNVVPMPQSPKRQSANPKAFMFETMVCANGFLLSVTAPDGPQQFIFKTEDDLMEIFRETVFKRFREMKLKEKGNQNGREIDDERGTTDGPEKPSSGTEGTDSRVESQNVK